MNPFQMFGQNMPEFDEKKLKQMLPKLDSQTLEQAKSMAKLFGMTDEQIQQGINTLNQLKNQ